MYEYGQRKEKEEGVATNEEESDEKMNQLEQARSSVKTYKSTPDS